MRRQRAVIFSELIYAMALADGIQKSGKTIVWTNGCFDLFHAGHAASLKSASEHGDLLFVGVNSDRSVSALKGCHRPIISQGERAVIVASICCVDVVVIFDEDTPEEAIRIIKPDVVCKGDDYAPPNGKPMPERALVESYGGKVVFLPRTQGVSTSEIVERCAKSWKESP